MVWATGRLAAQISALMASGREVVKVVIYHLTLLLCLHLVPMPCPLPSPPLPARPRMGGRF